MIDTDGTRGLEIGLKTDLAIKTAIAIGTVIGIGGIRTGVIHGHLRLHRRRRQRTRKKVRLREVRRGSFDSFKSIYIGIAFFFSL